MLNNCDYKRRTGKHKPDDNFGMKKVKDKKGNKYYMKKCRSCGVKYLVKDVTSSVISVSSDREVENNYTYGYSHRPD